MLQDILSHCVGESRASADNTGTFHNGCGTDATCPEPTQARGRVEIPDWFLTSIEDRAGNLPGEFWRRLPISGEDELFPLQQIGRGSMTLRVVHIQKHNQ